MLFGKKPKLFCGVGNNQVRIILTGGDLFEESQLIDEAVLGLHVIEAPKVLLEDLDIEHAKRIIEAKQRLSDTLLPSDSHRACRS